MLFACSGNMKESATKEINFVTGDVIDYIAAEGQVYIRTEADDVNQDEKFSKRNQCAEIPRPLPNPLKNFA